MRDAWIIWRPIVEHDATLTEMFGPFPRGLPLRMVLKLNVARNELYRLQREETERRQKERETQEFERYQQERKASAERVPDKPLD